MQKEMNKVYVKSEALYNFPITGGHCFYLPIVTCPKSRMNHVPGSGNNPWSASSNMDLTHFQWDWINGPIISLVINETDQEKVFLFSSFY